MFLVHYYLCMDNVVPRMICTTTIRYLLRSIARNRNPAGAAGFWLGAGVFCTNSSPGISCLPRSISLPFLRPDLLQECCANGPLMRNRGFGFHVNFVCILNDVPQTNFIQNMPNFYFSARVLCEPRSHQRETCAIMFLLCFTTFQNAFVFFSHFLLRAIILMPYESVPT